MKRLWFYFAYLLIVWGGFRYFVRLPEVVEELWFKPVIWLIPLFWWNLSLTSKNKVMMFNSSGRLKSVIFGTILGVMYFVLLGGLREKTLAWNGDLMGVGIATAITEELVFSGFVMGYLKSIKRSRMFSLTVIAFMLMIMHLPILFFVYKLSGLAVVGALLLSGAMGVVNAWIRDETEDVSGSILARIGLNLVLLR